MEAGNECLLILEKAQGVRQATLTGYANHIRHFYNRFDHIWAKDEELKEAVMTHRADDIKPATYNLR